MTNQIISATRYNILQGRIEQIMGVGSGTYGYNQTINSSPVPIGKEVTAADMNNLYLDVFNARRHQTGEAGSTIRANYTVAEGGAYTDPDIWTVLTDPNAREFAEVSSDDTINEYLYKGFEDILDDIETNRFDASSVIAGQLSTINAGIDSTRTTVWGGNPPPSEINHEISFVFSDSNDRRAYFNAGGKIQIYATYTGGTPGDKTDSWQDMLDDATGVGRIQIEALTTRAFRTGGGSGSGTSSGIGTSELTSTYQQLYTVGGTGVYAANDYTIEAKLVGNDAIHVKIRFRDDATELGDERIDGTFKSIVNFIQPDSDEVSVPNPAATNLSTLQ